MKKKLKVIVAKRIWVAEWRVDDFTSTPPSFYCISPRHVQCNVTHYSDLVTENTKRCEAFRSVAKMNQSNSSLEASVEEFKTNLRLAKESIRQEEDFCDDHKQAGGGISQPKPKKTRTKKTSDEEDEEDDKRGKRKARKRDFDEESNQSDDHSDRDDNIFLICIHSMNR